MEQEKGVNVLKKALLSGTWFGSSGADAKLGVP